MKRDVELNRRYPKCYACAYVMVSNDGRYFETSDYLYSSWLDYAPESEHGLGNFIHQSHPNG